MAKKFMVVLAILVEAMVKADNPSFLYLTPNNPPSLIHLTHSPPFIFISPSGDGNVPIRRAYKKVVHGKKYLPPMTDEQKSCVRNCKKIIKRTPVTEILFMNCLAGCFP
jgi:hypothetical protein